MRKENVRTLNPPRILIAAAKSGSGKTTLTCALLEALKSRGLSVRAFKCGPDYIDTMFHQKVIGVPLFSRIKTGCASFLRQVKQPVTFPSWKA